MNTTSAQAAGIAVVAVLASATSVNFLGEALFVKLASNLTSQFALGSMDPRLIKIVWVAVSSLGYIAVFQAIFIAVLQYHYRHILGQWVYASWRWANTEVKSFATLRFSLNLAGKLQYRVCTYASLNDLKAARQGNAAATGDAAARACDASADLHEISVFYEYQLHAAANGPVARRGTLKINASQRNRLIADWQSSVDEQLIKGMWLAVRPRQINSLLEAVQTYQQNAHAGNAVHSP
ncbi:MAG: hypothetical protein ACOYKM_11100 [Caulobacterales bacterium]